MAHSAKGAGNFLGPLFIVSALVLVALAVTFLLSEEDIPNEVTVIAEDDFEARPAGAGTVPEGEADEEIDGITDKLEEVDPAAEGEETVPPAEQPEDEIASGGGAETDISDGNGAAEAAASDAPLLDPVDTDSGDGQPGDGVEDASNADAPAGRDAEVELNPEDGQDIVEDTDDGGTAFIPTPSGPEGRDDETIAD